MLTGISARSFTDLYKSYRFLHLLQYISHLLLLFNTCIARRGRYKKSKHCACFLLCFVLYSKQLLTSPDMHNVIQCYGAYMDTVGNVVGNVVDSGRGG